MLHHKVADALVFSTFHCALVLRARQVAQSMGDNDYNEITYLFITAMQGLVDFISGMSRRLTFYGY